MPKEINHYHCDGKSKTGKAVPAFN